MRRKLLAWFLAIVMLFGAFSSNAIVAEASILTDIAEYFGLAGDSKAELDDYQFDKVDIYSTFESGEVLKDSFYYTDDWFFQDTDQRNDALALISMQLVAATLEGKKDSAGAAFLKKLGFKEIGFYGFDSDDPDDCAFMWGRKTIEKDGKENVLLAIIIQSYSMDKVIKEKGWKQNFTVNGEIIDAEHYAFSKAADKVMPEILSLSGNKSTKTWIMGQSRGGALANIIASKLYDKTTYCETFEAPATVEAGAAGNFKNIYNYICSDDVVTMIPPWGMVRYGVDVPLNTPELEEKAEEELVKLGSAAAGMTQMDDKEEIVKNLVESLGNEIPDRKIYSEKQEGCKDPATYQDAIVNLVGSILNDSFSGISTDLLLDHLVDLLPSLRALSEAINNHSDEDYREATKGLYELLNTVMEKNPLTEDDVFLLLKIAGKALINTEAGPDVEDPTVEVLNYISPIISLAGEKDSLLYSHHFDTLVARLKALAPAPKLPDMDIEIPEPQAEDSATKTPKDGIAAIGDAFAPSISWEGNDSTLMKDKTYYLDVELHAPGRDAEGFQMTINGQKPVEEPQITYVDGEYVIKATWEYVLGEPEKVVVSFDNGGIESDPEPVKVEKGSRLKYAITPEEYTIAHKDERAWLFQGWFDGETSWEDVIVDEDITLKSSWQEVIDKIELSFKIPHVGDSELSLEVPEGAHYELGEPYLLDENYNTIEGPIPGPEPLELGLDINGTDIPFYSTINENEESIFLGKVYINGEEFQDYFFDVDRESGLETVHINYPFNPLTDKEEENKDKEDKKEDKTDGSGKLVIAEEAFLPLQLKSTKQKKTSINLNWKKVPGATTYQVYGCKKGKTLAKLADRATNSYKDKKRKKSTYYKYVVIALDAAGNQLAKSKPIFVATKGKGNYKSVVIKVKDKKAKGKKAKARIKKSVKLKAGDKIKLNVTAKKTAKKLKKCAAVRFESSAPAIATVSAKGKVVAKTKGTCQIYAYMQNGVSKSIKVIVK